LGKTDRNKIDQEIIALATEGLNPAEIAFKFNLTCAYVIKVLVKNQTPAKFDFTGKARHSTYGKLPIKSKKLKKRTAGRSKKVRRKKYTDEFLLNHLKELYNKLGRAPQVRDLFNAGIVNASIYRIRFGSLPEAKKAAGLFTHKSKKKKYKYTDEYLINLLKELAEKLGRTPSKNDIDESGKVSSSTYRKYFGGIIKAQQEAGLVPN